MSEIGPRTFWAVLFRAYLKLMLSTGNKIKQNKTNKNSHEVFGVVCLFVCIHVCLFCLNFVIQGIGIHAHAFESRCKQCIFKEITTDKIIRLRHVTATATREM